MSLSAVPNHVWYAIRPFVKRVKLETTAKRGKSLTPVQNAGKTGNKCKVREKHETSAKRGKNMKLVQRTGKTWNQWKAREKYETSAKRWKNVRPVPIAGRTQNQCKTLEKKMGLSQSAGTTATEPYLQSDVKRVTEGTRVILFFFSWYGCV